MSAPEEMGDAPSKTSPQEWEPVADAALAAIAERAEKLVRKAADDFYGGLLYSVQDYLCDNAGYNIRSRIEAADRQARQDRTALRDERGRVHELRDALRSMVLCARTTGGTAGPDHGLMAACEEAENLLTKSAAWEPF